MPIERDPAEVSGWLRSARRHADLSQRQLAVRAGVSQSALARVEAHGRPLNAHTLLALLAACGCRLVLVDARDQPLLRAPDGLRDRAGRRYPAHLDVFGTRGNDWWGRWRGWLGPREPAPAWTFHLDRHRRDEKRADRLGG